MTCRPLFLRRTPGPLWRAVISSVLACLASPALANMDATEVTIGAFRAFVQATGITTAAERAGGGQTYEGGWQQRPGWVWHAPYGQPGADDEPVTHVTHAEAKAYCT